MSGEALREAETRLRELLANGPVRASVAEGLAQKLGFSFTMLRLVKKKIGVESRKVTRDGETLWEWVPPRPIWDLDPIM